jgi:glyoxylase-like metal-dependent hydrolase (beta-lactamase superfamily II)
MTFVLAEEDAMFTADNVLGHGTAVFQDLTAYLQSLAKMKLLFHGRAYPGHGAVLEDGPARITMYIEHRRQREDQVLETLRSATDKAWTVMEIVKVIYSEIPEELHPAAAGGVAQILAKLESEGRVAHGAGDSWRLERSPSL